MIFCTTANPNPVPLVLVVKKGRNSFGIAACAIPGPLSATTMRCHPASSPSITSPLTVTRPPPTASAHASAAFRARFSSACRSSPSSPATSPKFPLHSIVIRGLARRGFWNQLRVSGNGGQSVLEFVGDSRRQLAERSQVFLELHALLERCQLRQIRQQADNSANFSFTAADGGDGHAQVPGVPGRWYILDFFSSEDSSRLETLRHQPSQC